MKSIIICSTQRSGSTLFAKDLNITKKLGNASEWFYELGWTNPLTENKNELQQKLDNLTKTCTGENGIASIKIMGNYYQAVVNNLRTLPRFSNIAVTDIFDQVFQNPIYVRIFRINKIKQAISLAIARQTGIYHSFEGQAKKIEVNKISDQQITNIINELEAGERKWDIYFLKKKIHPITIAYESYVLDPLYYLNLVANTIEIDIKDFNLNKRIKKVSSKANEELYLRYLKNLEKNIYDNHINLL